MKTLKYTKEWITVLSDDPHQLRYAWWHLNDIVINRGNDVKNIQNLLTDNPNIHPWIMNMLKGELNIEQGWDARCGGFANTVKEAWPIFSEHLKKAEEYLTKAMELEQVMAIILKGNLNFLTYVFASTMTIVQI